MMTDEQLQLLTAGIDGELTPKEARRLRRLLASSVEARAVYEKLKADSDWLRDRPRVQPPPDLHTRVMARLAAATPAPVLCPVAEPAPCAPPFSRNRNGNRGRWVPVAVAASVLLFIAAGSFWFFTRDGDPGPKRRGAGQGDWAKFLPPANAQPPSTPQAGNGQRADREPVAVRPDADVPPPRSATPITLAQAPDPRPTRSDLVGFPAGSEIAPFDFVEVRVPFLRPLADLDREDIRRQLLQEFADDPVIRVDLFAREPARAAELFRDAARQTGLTVLADGASMDKLRKRLATEAVIYTDSLTAVELVDLFGRLCKADAKVSPHVFEMLHAVSVVAGDQRELQRVLGIDPGLFKRPAAEKGEKGTDSSKPISAGTTDHVVKNLTSSQSGKPHDRTAVLMTWGPPTARTPPANSQELKHFLAKRGERKPNAVPVIIVIRPGNG